MPFFITRRTGKTFNHAEEIIGTINSLKTVGKVIGAKLSHQAKYGNLSAVQVKTLEMTQKQVNSLRSKYQAILKQANKVKNTIKINFAVLHNYLH